MARKQTLEVAQQEGLERIVVAAVSRIGVLAPPWLVLALLIVLGAVSHWQWGSPPAVTWTTMASTLVTVALTALTWIVTHHRGWLGRWHSTFTTGGAGLWFTIANITGVTAPITAGMAFFGGFGLALAWNIRAVIRQMPSDNPQVDKLKALFDGAKTAAGLDGATIRTKEITPAKATAELTVPDGKTVPDVQKKVEVLEAAAEVPPGTFTVAANENNAGRAHFTAADPRIMNKPILWPGPSRPGRSIAEPLRVGLFQDGDPVEILAPGANLQVMGASGSGKSIGGAWNYLGEAITRTDVAIFAIDISKGDQTLGPLRPALHRLETSKSGASSLIEAIYSSLEQRTQWLTEHGYTDWEEGCGLSYWILWLEEAAKAFGELSDRDIERIEQIAKEIRSAGGRLVASLQKSIFSEMSTVVRSQLSYWCFGLNADDDVSYGLSGKQKDLGVSPDMWGAGRPEHQGKSFIDAPGIPETHIAMPNRTFHWGAKSQAPAIMAAHAAQYPATARPGDDFTRRIAGPGGSAAPQREAIPMPAARSASVRTPATDEPVITAPESPAAADMKELLALAVETVVATGYASTQMLQRKLRLPHADCLRVMEVLERRGVVGPDQEGAREVLKTAEEAAEVVDDLREDGDTIGEYVSTEDPDPELTAGPNDEIREPSPEEDVLEAPKSAAKKMSPEAARGLVEDWIRHRHELGELSFTATDPELQAIRRQTGNSSRTWVNNVLMRISDTGALEVDNSGRSTVFRIVDVRALDRVGASA